MNVDTAKKINVLVLGASGMLGHAMFRVLSKDANLNVYGSIRSNSSLASFSASEKNMLIQNIEAGEPDSLNIACSIAKPNVIINCIGIIKQLNDSREVLKTIPINTLLPHRLALLAKQYKSRLILMSTDCVFSGKKGGYVEDDFPDGDDVYGRSKLLGEIHDDESVITIRTSIIGQELQEGHSLINWFLKQTNAVEGYTQAIFSGLPTNELANIIHDHILLSPDLHGLYHIAAEPISKYDLLKLVAKAYGKNVTILESNKVQINRSLNDIKFQLKTGYKTKKWEELIMSMKSFHDDLY